MSDEGPYIGQYGVVPTRAQFDGAVRRLEDHLTALKRTKLDNFETGALAAEYGRYCRALEAFTAFERHEVTGFMRDWWRIDPIEDVDRVRRRMNRQRNLAFEHFRAMRAALVSRGSPGIEAIKGIFLEGEECVAWELLDLAVDYFPDEAQPVIEAVLAVPDPGTELRWRLDTYRRAIERINGYRTRSASSLAPDLSVPTEAGMAPALATLDQLPSEFPDLLFDRFVRNVFTGEMSFQDAANEAWQHVTEAKRLDPRHHEAAERAPFDRKCRDLIAKAILDCYGGGTYPQHITARDYHYLYPSGDRVDDRGLQYALYHACMVNQGEPSREAGFWTAIPPSGP